MVQRRGFISGYNKTTFTATTQDLRIDNGPFAVDCIDIAYDVEQEAVTANTVAAALDLVQPLKVTLEAKKIVEIRGLDLYALNVLWLGKQGVTMVGTATDEYTVAPAMRVPICSKAGSTVSTLATRVAVTNADTERLTLVAKYAEKGFSEHFEILTTSYTPTGTGVYNQAYDKTLEGSLVGFLLFATTLRTGGTDTQTIDSIRVKVNGAQVIETSWDALCIDGKIGYHDLLASPASATILDNFVWVDLSDDPPKKGERVTLEISSDDTNAVRIVEVVKVAN